MLAKNSLLVNGYDMAQLGLVVGTWPGFLDSPQRRLELATLWGRDGAALSTTEARSDVREVQVNGVVIQGSVAATREAWNNIKQRLDQGLIEVVFGDEPTLRFHTYCMRASMIISQQQMFAPGGQVDIRLLALNPYRESIEPSIASLSQAPRAITTGTGPSTGVIQLRDATDPLVTYRDHGGRIRAQIALQGVIATDEYVDINMQTAGITHVDASGVRTNAIAMFSAGEFFAVDARHANPEYDAYPTLEVSSGTGVFLYRRTWL